MRRTRRAGTGKSDLFCFLFTHGVTNSTKNLRDRELLCSRQSRDNAHSYSIDNSDYGLGGLCQIDFDF